MPNHTTPSHHHFISVFLDSKTPQKKGFLLVVSSLSSHFLWNSFQLSFSHYHHFIETFISKSALTCTILNQRVSSWVSFSLTLQQHSAAAGSSLNTPPSTLPYTLLLNCKDKAFPVYIASQFPLLDSLLPSSNCWIAQCSIIEPPLFSVLIPSQFSVSLRTLNICLLKTNKLQPPSCLSSPGSLHPTAYLTS